MTNNTLVKFGFVVLSLLLSGCIPHNIIDEVSLMHNIGFDREKKMLKGIVAYPNYQQGNNSSLISALASNPSNLREQLGYKSQYKVEMGQLRVIIFGNKLSTYGLAQILDTICRDPQIGIVRIVITNGSPSKIFQKTLNESPLYLMNLIDQSIKNEGIPESNIHTTYDQYFGSGIDMSFPLLIVDSSGKVKVNGMGIFKEDKLKYKISTKEALFFKLMTDRNKSGVYNLKLTNNNDSSNIGVRFLYGKHKITIINKNNREEAKINLVLNVELAGLPDWMTVENEKDYKKIINELEKSISRDTTTLLKNLQAKNVDPIGFGRMHKIHHNKWSEDNFYKNIYPKMTFNVSSNIIIRQAGVGK
ncbi:Ger(x)C family spore germination protein [Neobacillus sp. NPDC093182]|uniref:Ger(x)C family spore germination protein n=1 Tax=Neobacillus sp. NPDC093182 TaxID=3364297 RepID=UPI003812A2C0